MRLENALLIAAGAVAMMLWEAAQVSGDSRTPLTLGWIAITLFAAYSIAFGRRKSS
jgi:ABC-type nitrate/sulfonate/bicarbonate transport system substrate-binding protein